jgi:hypothetical protein
VPTILKSEPLTRLLTFTCPHCHKPITIRVRKALDFSSVASRNLECPSCSQTFERVLIGPILEGPFERDIKSVEVPRRENSTQYQAVTADAKSLTDNRELAVLMFRLGASINSMRSA